MAGNWKSKDKVLLPAVFRILETQAKLLRLIVDMRICTEATS